MKRKMISFLLAASVVIPAFLSTNTFSATTKAKQNSATDGIATVIKSAEWINESKTEAEITIEVQTQKVTKTISENVKNGDIIFILDRSGSMGDKVQLNRQIIENNIMKNAANSFLEGEFGNRVAYGEFDSALWIFTDKEGSDFKYDKSRYKDYVYGYETILTNANTITSAEEAKDEMLKTLEKVPSTLRFYTNTSDINAIIDRAYNEDLNGNTDFNLPLIWARCLLEKRDGREQTRKPYIIFITDGQPYPNTDSLRSSLARQTSLNYRKGQWIANKYAVETAKILRENYNAEIYTIILDTGNADYDLWNGITGDIGAGATQNTTHIYSIANERTQYTAQQTMNDILNIIYSDMNEKAIREEVAELNAVLTDIVNTKIFSVSNASNAISTNIGEATLSGDKKTITWKFSGVKYGEKCADGKWPTLKIRINLNDVDRYGDDLNTNMIIDEDDDCILIHPEGTPVKVKTPWLERNESSENIDDDPEDNSDDDSEDNSDDNSDDDSDGDPDSDSNDDSNGDPEGRPGPQCRTR